MISFGLKVEEVLHLKFPGEPKAVQSFRFTKEGRRYQPGETTSWKGMLRIMTLDQLPEDWKLLDEPLYVEAAFVFMPKKALGKRKLALIDSGEFMPKETKPDLTDNLMKGLCDALTTIVWKDDARVVQTSTIKAVGALPRIEMTIFRYKEK